jgi:type VI protein secretion system component VasK
MPDEDDSRTEIEALRARLAELESTLRRTRRLLFDAESRLALVARIVTGPASAARTPAAVQVALRAALRAPADRPGPRP